MSAPVPDSAERGPHQNRPSPGDGQLVVPGDGNGTGPEELARLAAEPEEQGPRRAGRVARGAWLGGVCTGLAEHLGWPLMAIRVGFVALMTLNFIGALVYAALWLLLPLREPEKAPGLEAASRTNMRTTSKSSRRRDAGSVLALVLMSAGLIWLVQSSGWGVPAQIFWPVAFACAGVALVWRTADDTGKQEKADENQPAWLAPFVSSSRLLTIARMVLGMTLVGAAVGSVIASQTSLALVPQVLAMSGLALAGTALVVAPWIYRSQTQLRQVREEKVRADARADMAAHLHDSVLQTLALIQRQSDDPKSVQTLARRQERELRGWLYGDVIREETMKAALTSAAAEVEDERGVNVDLVCVGDAPMDERVEAMIRAAREAMVNAAKHSGSDRIDVFAEATEDSIEVFVRDRGKGFDLDEIADDRMGVKGSIIGRMERHGGTARIRTSAETGTEVKLEMSR